MSMAAVDFTRAPGNDGHLQPEFAWANTNLRKRHIGQTDMTAITQAMAIPVDGDVSTFGM